jgi:Domain of unknown function (DUF4136)
VSLTIRFKFLLCLAAIVTAADAQSTKVNWQSKAPFADYKTYAFRFTPKQQDSFYRQFVTEYLPEQLTKKGLSQVSDPSKADLVVTYHFVTQEMIDASTSSDGFGWGGGHSWGPWGYWGGWGGWGEPEEYTGFSTTEEHPRTMGILTIDLFDAKKKQLVWRGQATEDSVSSSQKGDAKQVRKSIDKMFEHYPPKQG